VRWKAAAQGTAAAVGELPGYWGDRHWELLGIVGTVAQGTAAAVEGGGGGGNGGDRP